MTQDLATKDDLRESADRLERTFDHMSGSLEKRLDQLARTITIRIALIAFASVVLFGVILIYIVNEITVAVPS